MKETMNKNILKKASVLLIATVMFLSTVAVTANTNESPEFMSAGGDYISHPQQTNTFDPDWLHYDDGTSENALGLTAGGVMHEVIKLTPDELGGYTDYEFTKVKVMHGCPLYPGQPAHDYTVWMYTGTTAPADPMVDATIVATGTCPAVDDWVEIDTDIYVFAPTDTVWIGVAWDHNGGEFPMGFDTGTNIPGKAGWLYSIATGWTQLHLIGYPGAWNLWAEITGEAPPDTVPPVTNCTLSGIKEGDVYISDVTVTLTATDDQSGVNYTMYRLDDGENQTYTEPFIVSELGEHIVYYHSVDNAGNIEDEKNCTFVRGEPAPQPELEITSITGFIGVKATIKNVGEADATDVEWKLTIRGGILDRIDVKVEGNASNLAVNDSIIVQQIIFGLGNIDIRVTAEASNAEKVTERATAFVIGIFVIGITIEE